MHCVTFGETLVRDSFLWLHVASYGLVAVVWLKWPQRLLQHCTNSRVQPRPSAQLTASFEAPYITLHTGKRAAETTDGKPRKTSSHSLHFLFPPAVSVLSPFCSKPCGPTHIHWILPSPSACSGITFLLLCFLFSLLFLTTRPRL